MADLNKHQPDPAPVHTADPIVADGEPREVATAPSPKGEVKKGFTANPIPGNKRKLH